MVEGFPFALGKTEGRLLNQVIEENEVFLEMFQT